MFGDMNAAVIEILLLRLIGILTRTWLGSADLSVSPISLAVFSPQLRHRSIAVSYSGDLSFSTSH